PGRVEHVAERSGRGPHEHGLRGDQVTAVSPGPAERHGMRVLPDQAKHVRRGELPSQRAAYHAEPVFGRHSSRLSAASRARVGRDDKSSDVTSAQAPVQLKVQNLQNTSNLLIFTDISLSIGKSGRGA